jgi:RNA polymerase sigma-70 factor (ECF subfamily)
VDTDLVLRAQAGDHDAFSGIVAAMAQRFHGVAFAILRDPTLAEDAAQGAMVSVWRDLPRLRDATRFDAWAYRILVNACYGESRRTRWRDVNLDPEAEGRIRAPDDLRGVLDRDEIERGFARLSVDQRAVLVAHYFLDLPSDEAADALGIPVGTYKSRLHRANEAMRAALEADARPDTMHPSTPEVAR